MGFERFLRKQKLVKSSPDDKPKKLVKRGLDKRLKSLVKSSLDKRSNSAPNRQVSNPPQRHPQPAPPDSYASWGGDQSGEDAISLDSMVGSHQLQKRHSHSVSVG